MRRVADTSPTLNRIVDTSPTLPRVDPAMVAAALGAEPATARAYARAARHESRDALWIAGMASSASTPPVIERDIIEVFRRYVERAAERAIMHGGMHAPDDLPETRKLLALARCDPDAIRWDRFVDAIRESAAELDATIDYGRPA